MRLNGQVALVTGAATGIGEGIARRFAAEGATVVVTDRDGPGAATVAAALRDTFGTTATDMKVNVGYEDQVTRMVEQLIAEHGRLDILVNNAQGYNGMASLQDKTTAEFDYSLRTGPYASFWAMRAAFPQMREQGGGSIINLASIDGINGRPLLSDYVMAKEAIRGLTKVAAREWGPYQIRVNCLAPFAASRVVARSTERMPEFANLLKSAPPLGRVGDCEQDVGGVALFLACEDSRYVTGMTIYADGGMFLAPPPVPTEVDPSWPRPKRELQWVSGSSRR